jgi:hypothetical protein
MPWIDWNTVLKVLVIGLLAGAGLPALFAIGLRALSMGPGSRRLAAAGGDPGRPGRIGLAHRGPSSSVVATSVAEVPEGGEDDRVWGGNILGMIVAVVCFTVVLAGVGWGIYSIVAGS